MAKKKEKQKFDKNLLNVAIDSISSALGHFDTGNYDELLAQTGKTRQELLGAVMADDEVISCREDIFSALLAKPWRIWGKDVDENIINALYKWLRPLAHEFAELAILARFNGYAVAEYVYDTETNPQGLYLIDSVLSKDGELDKYSPKRDGSLLYNATGGEEELNKEIKFLLLRSKAVPARPAGEMLVIRAYPAVLLRKRGWAYASQFIARYAQPYVVGQQGGYADINQFTNTLYGLLNGGAAGINQDDNISIHQLSGNGEAFERLEQLANARIQKLLLGRVKNSEMSVGSRSAQETDDKVREHRMRSYLDLMAQAIQHAINAMLTVNDYYGTPIHAPQGIWFEYEEQTKVDIDRAERDKLYCDTGQMKLTKEYLVNIVGYEEQHIEMVETPTVQPSMPLSLQLSQQHDDHNHDDFEPKPNISKTKVDAILSILNDCENYAEFEKRLENLGLPDGGMVKDLGDKMTEQFVKGLAGVQDG